jgi:hypothetical protein
MQDTVQTLPGRIGPTLYLRGHAAGRLDLAAVVIDLPGRRRGDLVSEFGSHSPERIGGRDGRDMLRYRFSVPDRAGAWYTLGGERFEVTAGFEGDLRIAFVSCNGQELGDRQRSEAERNLMWRRLMEQHGAQPFQLILHGGDQLYADEVTRAHPLSADWPRSMPEDIDDAQIPGLREALESEFFRRYLAQLAQPEFAWLSARVPSLAMWDDHDICDGWGSLPEHKLDSILGRCVFAAARASFLQFQFGAAPDEVPDICPDRTGTSLGWCVELPGLTVIAPDLRSERRPTQVMGERGWDVLLQALDAAPSGRLLVLSSVPALGPRLSLVERAMSFTPWMEKYEDDLRDQWQSRAHRTEWRDFLRALITRHARPESRVTVVSGEIHLASRGTMATADGDLHQLVASGITHPAPSQSYARGLGALAWLGETPLPGHPIRLHSLPGRRGIYTAERNFLVLERRKDAWSAVWELEKSGPTPELPI